MRNPRQILLSLVATPAECGRFALQHNFNRPDVIMRSGGFSLEEKMTPSTIAAALLLVSASAIASGQQPSAFRAERIVRNGHFTVDAAPDNAFPLFTPLGELHWAAGWNPEILYPSDGHPVEGLLFRTNDHGGMYWWLTRYEPEKHVIEYHAIIPDGFARNIRVECKAAGNRTEVIVTDTYIGLSEHGNQFVRSMDEASYKRKMKGWAEPISQYLKTHVDANR